MPKQPKRTSRAASADANARSRKSRSRADSRRTSVNAAKIVRRRQQRNDPPTGEE